MCCVGGTRPTLCRAAAATGQTPLKPTRNNPARRNPPAPPADKAAAQAWIEFSYAWMADPAYFGDYPASMRAALGPALPKFTPEQSAMLKVGAVEGARRLGGGRGRCVGRGGCRARLRRAARLWCSRGWFWVASRGGVACNAQAQTSHTQKAHTKCAHETPHPHPKGHHGLLCRQLLLRLLCQGAQAGFHPAIRDVNQGKPPRQWPAPGATGERGRGRGGGANPRGRERDGAERSPGVA